MNLIVSPLKRSLAVHSSHSFLAQNRKQKQTHTRCGQ